MKNAIKTFDSLIDRLDTSQGLYGYIEQQKIPIDASDLLRWQWVMTVYALDKYIHDIVRAGMVEEFLGKRSQTDKYKNFHITMSSYLDLSSSKLPQIDFEREVTYRHSFLAFQSPDKISDALAYIWSENKKWEVISKNMTTPISEKDLKTQLNNIVLRRNQIVHEGDCLSFISPLQQQEIYNSDVEDVINFIAEIVHAINSLVI